MRPIRGETFWVEANLNIVMVTNAEDITEYTPSVSLFEQHDDGRNPGWRIVLAPDS